MSAHLLRRGDTKNAALLSLLLLLAGSLPARADDVRIYRGVIRSDTFSYMNTDSSVTNAYAVIDYTTRRVTLVAYDPAQRTHNETTLDLTFGFEEEPAAPIGKTSRTFLYAGVPAPGVAADLYRFLSTSKPTMQPISSSVAVLTSKSLVYSHDFAAPAAYNTVEGGTFKYQKKLTVTANDANSDLAGATTIVLDDLRAHDVID